MKRIATVLLTVALIFGTASAASAAVTKSGTQTCTAAQGYGYAASYSSAGYVSIQPPGKGASGTVTWYNTGWTVHAAKGAWLGGYWHVKVTTGSLNDAGTYGYCSNLV